MSGVVGRWLRRVVLVLALSAASVWAAGSMMALWGASFPPGACTAPYRAWALTWPAFMALPEAGRQSFVDWSFTLCP